MRPIDADPDIFSRWEGAVAFRLFADQADPTLTVPEQIAASLGERIVAGELPPGARIAEQELADHFQVSRGPVREAIRMLEREGLVCVLARRGAIVTELSAQELRDLYEIRSGLFEIVARRIMAQPNDELRAMLRAGVQRLKTLTQGAQDGDAYAETTYRLLILCARFAGTQRLQKMLTALSLQTLRYSKLGLATVARRRRSCKLWQEAADALESGDVERLILLTRQRIDESAEEAVRVMQAAADAAGQP